MARYADDFVVLCASEEEARDVLEELRQSTGQVGLKLHDQKTRIVDGLTPERKHLISWAGH